MSSSSPRDSRKETSRPICASVWVRKPAKTSCWRACIRRSSSGSDDHSSTHGGRGVSTVPSGTTPADTWRAKASLRQSSQPPVVAAAVGGDPFGGHVVGGVHGPEGEVEEEGLPRRRLLLVQDVADGGRGQVLAQVVTVLRAARRVDVVVVADQVGRPVVGVALEEAVVALEPHPERPAVEGAGGRPLPARREVPLADGQGAVAGVAQQAGEGRRALGQPGGVAGVAHRQVGQKAHPHRVVVASGEERGPGRRAQGGHVEAVVAQPAVGQAVDVRRGDVRAEAPQLGEAGVVEDDGHHVGGTRGRLGLGGMDGRRLRDGEAESSVGGHRAPPSVGLEGEGGRLGTGPGYVERARRLTPGAGPPPRRRA